ncbi:MAG: PD-(D/E)XK nuclease family protein [Bacteroides sp.]|nr:PD-(D/E)XK nuclease family protein [Bacteroides sp.]
METFLKLVAGDLFSKKGTDLSDVAVVFPNKRAGLFFNRYLSDLSDKPIWAPSYLTISELFLSLSPIREADPIKLICELHKVFCQQTQSQESLDDFYFWGELLLKDFDDVDKNRIPADKLFRSLQELKELGDPDEHLEKEQEEAIQQFFDNFSLEKLSHIKEKFISLWDKLGAIYQQYRRNLLQQEIGYEGMIQRMAIDTLNTEKLEAETYVFVGFNALNRVESRLFQVLRQQGKALFYWDYDIFYTQMAESRHEAGIFLKRNLKEFPNELPEKWFDSLRKPKKISFISSSTENAQARYMTQWAKELQKGNENENAVVLCNENVLLPVLHALPQEIKNINLTMGFPLSQTPIHSFINSILELHIGGYDKKAGYFMYEYVQKVLRHPYLRQLSIAALSLDQELTRTNRFYPYPSELKKDRLLEILFTPVSHSDKLCRVLLKLIREITPLYREKEEEKQIFTQLYKESLFKAYTLINRMLGLIEKKELSVMPETFSRLLNQLLGSTSIPFRGEPAIGMQIMGVLETRNLDFRNLLILSLNEGTLPKKGGDSSFIPYSLRRTFGMSTVEDQNAIYAYYFYRMIQRAEHISLVYHTGSDGINKGESSRYMLQLLLEWPHDIQRYYLHAPISLQSTPYLTVRKDATILRHLHETYGTEREKPVIFSPSALNTYLDCRMKFYFRYVAGLSAPQEVTAEIDSAKFGTIFHKAAEWLYQELTVRGPEIRKEDIERMLNNEIGLSKLVDKAFKKEFFFSPEEEKAVYNGIQLINSKVIVFYLRQLLRNDLMYAPFEMIAMEEKVSETLTVKTSSRGEIKLCIGGTIDRVDRKGDTIRVVDYKTGGSPKSPAHIGQLFTPAEKRPGYVFQTFLYAALMTRQQPAFKVAPALLYIHKAASEEYSPVIEIGEAKKKSPVTDFSLIEKDFRQSLSHLLEEIFNEEEAFTQTEFPAICTYCDFKGLCKK